jgi:hypothetical protein
MCSVCTNGLDAVLSSLHGASKLPWGHSSLSVCTYCIASLQYAYSNWHHLCYTHCYCTKLKLITKMLLVYTTIAVITLIHNALNVSFGGVFLFTRFSLLQCHQLFWCIAYTAKSGRALLVDERSSATGASDMGRIDGEEPVGGVSMTGPCDFFLVQHFTIVTQCCRAQ